MGKVSRRVITAGATTLVVGQVVQVVIAFATNIVLVRHIAPEGFGRFAIMFATASLIVSLVSLRVNALIIRVPDGQLTRSLEERYFSYLTIETIFALFVSLAWVTLAGYAGAYEYLLVIIVCAQHWISQNKSFFERSMPYVRLGLIETGCSVFANLATIALALTGAGVAALYFRELVITVCLFLALVCVRGLTWRRLRWLSRREWVDTMREGRAIWLDGLLENSYQRVTILLAGMAGGDRGAGFLFQAYRLAILPNQLLSPLVSRIAINLFGREERQEKRKQFRNRHLLILAPILAVTTIFTIIFAVPGVKLIYGETWAKSADLLIAFAGVIMFMSLFEVLRSYCFISQFMDAVLIGRLVQYSMFGAVPVFLSLGLVGEMMPALALSISIGWAGAFVTVAIVLLCKRA